MKFRRRVPTVVLAASLFTAGAVTGPAAVDAAPNAVPPTVRGCKYTEFCTYATSNYSVMVDRMSSCTWHRSHTYYIIPC